MADLEPRLTADLAAAMRAKLPELTTLRMLRAALQNEAIVLRARGATLGEAEVVQVFRRELKKRQEAARLYDEAGRSELAQTERIEAVVIERYLPLPPPEADVRVKAESLKAELGLSGQQAMGRLVKALLEHFGSALDGQTASRIAREILAT